MSKVRQGMSSLSEPFIRRPVATTLVTIGLALLGIAAFGLLAVAPLPQVSIPTIVVQASLPGAGPKTMAQSVATPLERQLGRISGITEMTSQSTQDSTTVTLQFDLSRNINAAGDDVQAALNAARAQLPSGMPDNPTYRKVNPAESPVLVLALTSRSLTPEAIYDEANTIISKKVSQVVGVGLVKVVGSSPRAVRVDLNPTALNKYGIDFDTVRAALQNNNANRPLGFIESDTTHWQILANDQLSVAAQYRDVVIDSKNGADVQLSDIAEVTDSVEDIRNEGFYNGDRAVLVVVSKQPDANIIGTVDRVLALLPQLRASVSSGIAIDVAIERTSSIRASLHDAERTLIVSTLLVITVVFLFIRSWRAMLVPTIVVPMSLMTTFAAMYLLDYSLNTFTLMALTIATGFVIDDTVVVLENISRHIEAGMSRLEAVLLGTREVSFTVVSMSLSLIAVFIPILFFPGMVGRYFREFSITLSIAVVVSLVMSLTTAPMICAQVLARRDRKQGPVSRWGKKVFGFVLRFYERTLRFALSKSPLVMFILLVTIGLNLYLYIKIDKGFFPPEDTGRLYASVEADQAISFKAYSEKVVEFMDVIRGDPAVDAVATYSVGSTGGGMFAALKPWNVRGISTDDVVDRLKSKANDVAGARLSMVPAQDIRIGARMGNGSYQYTLQSDNLDALHEWAPKVTAALENLPELADVSGDQETEGLAVTLEVDRARASRLGVTMEAIDDTLNDSFSQRQVSTIYGPWNQQHVIMGVGQKYLQTPEALKDIYVRGTSGDMVPLMAFARYHSGLDPFSVNHQNQFVASTISFGLAKGVTLSQARESIERTMALLHVPVSVHGGFQGNALEAQKTFSSLPWLILAALLTVYIVLGILYESFVHPLTILSTLPSAGVGTLLALRLFDIELSLIAFIGILLLIGIVQKNAIMMIDFALDAEKNLGLSSSDAVFQACLLRFRPIMMTTFAAMLGALPLAFGGGEGWEMRQPLGISIIGGLFVSQVLTLYSTPVVYLYMDRFRLWCKRKFRVISPAAQDFAPGA
ncbi:efflux RND transporter permease subunit [Solilutibacter silvestris]|uniref:Cation/multidrug efflux pump n=1 Tax=Solilutibacter silvestris TaxID=1645665 RepID=A0A2K1PX09_9GAMM|nr:efflux RND transporter permease subunit [Lysobacter silvestris]PNS07330.1 Cation/multidrug efflux pump [Lysobacter silvestris]